MKNLVRITCVVAAAIALFAVNASATIIADWTFETSYVSITGTSTSKGPLSPEVGSGSATGVHQLSTTWSAVAGDGSAKSFSANQWTTGDYFQFQVSTVGYSGITVDWDQTSSNTGPSDFILQYSTSGTSFTTFGGDLTVYNNNAGGGGGPAGRSFWSSATYDSNYHYSINLGSVVDNSATVYFRVTDNNALNPNGGIVASGGTDRIDNFLVQGIPEPSTIMLVGFGLASCVLAIRRRRS